MIALPTAPVRIEQEEHDTEPLPMAGDGRECGICGQPATQNIYCVLCSMPLCGKHTKFRMIEGEIKVLCPEQAKGAPNNGRDF